ncbi:hypothetical protein DM808_01580 [Blattabacterium punctulatus]|uniref:Uncharacterized protein n=1 Tax=Blattabacterium punctulatus TaxID=164514 RepID=A0ABN5M633_9FLAO|nr:hypothetical protein DM808_01580 [Blattabacterium punctulatus]AWU40397.1 hypothetical protein DM805_01585 [Blattabacterium punctulatus]
MNHTVHREQLIQIGIKFGTPLYIYTYTTVFYGVYFGFNHFIRAMFSEAYHYYIENIFNPYYGLFRFYPVVGYICESYTFGLNNKNISEIMEGYIFCVLKMWGLTVIFLLCIMSSNYNYRYRPY